MKKRYLTKSNMARALSNTLAISLQDAKSRLSKEKPPLVKEVRNFEIEGEQIEVVFWLTPKRFISGA